MKHAPGNGVGGEGMRTRNGFDPKQLLLLAGLMLTIFITGSQGAMPAAMTAETAADWSRWAEFDAERAERLAGQCSALLANEGAARAMASLWAMLSLQPERMLPRPLVALAAAEPSPLPVAEETPPVTTLASRGRTGAEAVDPPSAQPLAAAKPELLVIPEPATASALAASAPSVDEVAPVAAFKRMTILSYCTHSSESYIPDSGVARQEGQAGMINQVAERLSRQLKRYGFKAEHDATIHDWPSYNHSYVNSRATVKALLEDNQNVVALFDIHRDSIPGATDGSTVSVRGRPAAQILIIVGSDGTREHPYWEENQRFAQELYQLGERKYPGLIRGVRTYEGSYHQEYHQGALLLEMGNDRNTLEEALYAAELLADLVAEYFR